MIMSWKKICSSSINNKPSYNCKALITKRCGRWKYVYVLWEPQHTDVPRSGPATVIMFINLTFYPSKKHLTWVQEREQMLNGPKSSIQKKVNLAFHLETKVPM